MIKKNYRFIAASIYYLCNLPNTVIIVAIYSIFFFLDFFFFPHWIGGTVYEHMHKCLCTQTYTHYFVKMLSQSQLLTGYSHDWNRVWNFYSNIHECRPALHHLCTSSVPRESGQNKGNVRKSKWGGEQKQKREEEIQKKKTENKKLREQWMRPHTRFSDCCLFQLARHDFTTASLFADMTSLMQTEPMPSSIS